MRRIYMQLTADRRLYILLQRLTGPMRMALCLCGVVSKRTRHLAILMACIVRSPVPARGYGAKSATSVYTVQYAHNELTQPVSLAAYISQVTGQGCCLR
jgi:hypothetical protein